MLLVQYLVIIIPTFLIIITTKVNVLHKLDDLRNKQALRKTITAWILGSLDWFSLAAGMVIVPCKSSESYISQNNMDQKQHSFESQKQTPAAPPVPSNR